MNEGAGKPFILGEGCKKHNLPLRYCDMCIEVTIRKEAYTAMYEMGLKDGKKLGQADLIEKLRENIDSYAEAKLEQAIKTCLEPAGSKTHPSASRKSEAGEKR